MGALVGINSLPYGKQMPCVNGLFDDYSGHGGKAGFPPNVTFMYVHIFLFTYDAIGVNLYMHLCIAQMTYIYICSYPCIELSKQLKIICIYIFAYISKHRFLNRHTHAHLSCISDDQVAMHVHVMYSKHIAKCM